MVRCTRFYRACRWPPALTLVFCKEAGQTPTHSNVNPVLYELFLLKKKGLRIPVARSKRLSPSVAESRSHFQSLRIILKFDKGF